MTRQTILDPRDQHPEPVQAPAPVAPCVLAAPGASPREQFHEFHARGLTAGGRPTRDELFHQAVALGKAICVRVRRAAEAALADDCDRASGEYRAAQQMARDVDLVLSDLLLTE